jgi:hypothetical protein
MKALAFLLLLAALPVTAQIVLENSAVSSKDKADAQRIRDNTTAPSSFVGDVASKIGQSIAEGSRHQTAACNEGKCDWVMVNFEVIAGFSTEGVDRKFWLSAKDSSTGRTEANASQTGATIFKSNNPDVSGLYNWRASWDRGRKNCAGVLHVSGAKPNMTLSVFSDCRRSGSAE